MDEFSWSIFIILRVSKYKRIDDELKRWHQSWPKSLAKMHLPHTSSIFPFPSFHSSYNLNCIFHKLLLIITKLVNTTYLESRSNLLFYHVSNVLSYATIDRCYIGVPYHCCRLLVTALENQSKVLQLRARPKTNHI